MRFNALALLMGAASLVQGQKADTKAASTKPDTVFNGVSVPPLLELTPANWAAETKKSKFLMVKHYSPYCPHCIDFAPVYQTFYEFYYTSHPEDAPTENFSDYYSFRFGMINCVAYYDLCVEHGVQTYPRTSLFENGKDIGAVNGAKSMTLLRDLIEPALETAKPGSRPELVDLPKTGDKEFPKGAAEVNELKKDSAPVANEKANQYDDSMSKEKQQKISDDAESKLPARNSANKDKVSEKEGSGETAEKSDKSAEKSSDSTTEKSKSEKLAEKIAEKKIDPDLLEDNTLKGFQQDWKAPTSGEVYNSKERKKPTVTPNQVGKSISLNPESFQRMVTMTQDPWFIKFYAPWCPHCQAMGPTWEQLAKTMRGKLNIGEVNCDEQPRLCKEVGARSYPTILFFKGGERAEYSGLRGLGDFVQYAEGALDLSGGVPEVNAAELAAIEDKEEVVFVYLYDHATTSEDFNALERMPLSLIGHAKLVKSNDPVLYDRFKVSTWPRLLVTRQGRPTYYTPRTPNAMRDVNGVLDWMKSVWLPLVPELTASNAKQIMDGKIVVLGILNREDKDSYETGVKELRTAANEWMDRQISEFQLERKKLRDAKQMRVEEAQDRDDERALRAAKAIRIDMNQSGRKEVGFAWVDGVFWQRWIRTTYGIDVSEGERVVINDQDSRKYWDQTATGNYIMVSRTAISESLDKIVYGPNTIPYKLTTSLIFKIFHDMGIAFIEHPILSALSVVGLLVIALMWLRGRSRRARSSGGGYFKLDEKMSGLGNLGNGLLGGAPNGNAKAD